MPENFGPGDTDIGGYTLSSQTLNGSLKNCILITAGQSNIANNRPDVYVPTNTGKVDNLNPYDGAVYGYKDPITGCSNAPPNNVGNMAGKLADNLINAGKFDRVIICPVAINGTTAANWQTVLYQRIIVALLRCSYRGMTPTAILWGQGESDHGTSQSSYVASMTSVINATRSAGYNGPWFIAQQTWLAGVVDATVQAAQAALVNHGANIWAGPNADSLGAGSRQADNTHFTDAGDDAYAGLWQTALGAFGPPF